jgi:hypothetical protein
MFTVGGTVIYRDHNGKTVYGVIESGNNKTVMVNIGNGNVMPFSTKSLEVIL